MSSPDVRAALPRLTGGSPHREAWKPRIRLLVVDDFPMMRVGLACALRDDPEIEIVGDSGSALEAEELVRDLQPDVALLDLDLAGLGGMAGIERMRGEAPETRMLAMTASERAESLLDALAAGAAGYLTKRASRDELRQAVITVHNGGSVITPGLAGHLLRDYARRARGDHPALRPLIGSRETEILRLIAQGFTDKEIGQRLAISARTVQNHLTRVREKTGLRRRSELARWAVEHAVT
jgi:DNA-binding NarL/FixJ family response regulator